MERDFKLTKILNYWNLYWKWKLYLSFSANIFVIALNFESFFIGTTKNGVTLSVYDWMID